jgi:hypothetical protein
MRARILSLTVLILALSLGAQAQSQNKRTLTFSHTPDIFSEGWDVLLDGSEISIKQNDYVVKDYGKFSLTEAESAEVWELIQSAEFKNLKFSDEPKGSCDTQYLFTLKDETGSNSISIDTWKADNERPLREIVNRLKGLIKKYAGVEPRFPGRTRAG